VNVTKIDYEDIRSFTLTDSSNSASSNSQYNIINKFYHSLTSDQNYTSIFSNYFTFSNYSITSPFSTSIQETASNFNTPNAITSSTPTVPLLIFNPFYNLHPQYYQSSDSTNSTFIPYP